MSPRQEAIENNLLSTDSEVFELDIVDYLKFSESEGYMTKEFAESFKYWFYGLLFVPQNQVITVF